MLLGNLLLHVHNDIAFSQALQITNCFLHGISDEGKRLIIEGEGEVCKAVNKIYHLQCLFLDALQRLNSMDNRTVLLILCHIVYLHDKCVKIYELVEDVASHLRYIELELIS